MRAVDGQVSKIGREVEVQGASSNELHAHALVSTSRCALQLLYVWVPGYRERALHSRQMN